MFDLRSYLMEGFREAVGNMPDYKIIQDSAGWFDKGVLLEEDLAELNELIGVKNTDQEKEDLLAAVEYMGIEDIPDEEVGT